MLSRSRLCVTIENGDPMPRYLTTLPFIAALSLGAALHAQEAETTEAETAAPEAAEAEPTPQPDADEPSIASELDMGKEVDDDPTYIKETYGDWQLKCFRSGGEDDLCQMYQLLREDAGNPVAEFSLFKLPENNQAVAGATIVVPLGTLLTEELRMSVDGGPAKSFAYAFCSVVGCFARIGLAEPDVEALKRGAEANLEIVPAQAPDQKVNIKVSLSGFTAAFDNVSTIQN